VAQKSWRGFTPPRSPELTPLDFYFWVCKANHLQYSYSQHLTLETAKQGSCCICQSWCSWSSVARNEISLRSLQSHQWSPHGTSINTWKNYLSCSLLLFIFNVYTSSRLIHLTFWNPTMDSGKLYRVPLWNPVWKLCRIWGQGSFERRVGRMWREVTVCYFSSLS
jgi:hypothetical protein